MTALVVIVEFTLHEELQWPSMSSQPAWMCVSYIHITKASHRNCTALGSVPHYHPAHPGRVRAGYVLQELKALQMQELKALQRTHAAMDCTL